MLLWDSIVTYFLLMSYFLEIFAASEWIKGKPMDEAVSIKNRSVQFFCAVIVFDRKVTFILQISHSFFVYMIDIYLNMNMLHYFRV
jgi:hypothetical protein